MAFSTYNIFHFPTSIIKEIINFKSKYEELYYIETIEATERLTFQSHVVWR